MRPRKIDCVRAVQVESGTFVIKNESQESILKVVIIYKNNAFDVILSIISLIHNGKISKRHFNTPCITLVQHILILIPSHHERAKTGLRPRFYLNCSRVFPLTGPKFLGSLGRE